jgi:hypothetical protein
MESAGRFGVGRDGRAMVHRRGEGPGMQRRIWPNILRK